MTNLVDFMDVLDDKELDIVLNYVKKKNKSAHHGHIPFCNKESLLEAIRGDYDAFSNMWSHETDTTFLKLLAKLTKRSAKVKEQHGRVIVYLYDEEGLVAKVAAKTLKHGKKKAARYCAGHKVYIRAKVNRENKGFIQKNIRLR